MPKAGKKNHIFGDFFSEATKKNAKTGKELGIEGKKIRLFSRFPLLFTFQQTVKSLLTVTKKVFYAILSSFSSEKSSKV